MTYVMMTTCHQDDHHEQYGMLLWPPWQLAQLVHLKCSLIVSDR